MMTMMTMMMKMQMMMSDEPLQALKKGDARERRGRATWRNTHLQRTKPPQRIHQRLTFRDLDI